MRPSSAFAECVFRSVCARTMFVQMSAEFLISDDLRLREAMVVVVCILHLSVSILVIVCIFYLGRKFV